MKRPLPNATALFRCTGDWILSCFLWNNEPEYGVNPIPGTHPESIRAGVLNENRRRLSQRNSQIPARYLQLSCLDELCAKSLSLFLSCSIVQPERVPFMRHHQVRTLNQHCLASALNEQTTFCHPRPQSDQCQWAHWHVGQIPSLSYIRAAVF